MSFKLSIFLSAFLLFIVQPLITKKLLPWFGGSATVWLCNLFFFQTVLLFGYLYSFFLTKISRVSWQIKIHFALMMLSLLFLPIIPNERFTDLNLWPPLIILVVLTTTLGLPCVLISASSPLFQFWHNHCYRTPFPYRYYALSNVGSLLGLLAFPFLLEPYFGLHSQLILWSSLYALFCLSALSTFRLISHQSPLPTLDVKATALSWQAYLPWLLLAFLSNALLLTITQVMMQNVISFPLLWLIPLALYLLTFIITFYSKKTYSRWVWITLFIFMFSITLYVPTHHQFLLSFQIAIYGLLLFSGCMICHGELVKLQPEKQHLPAFYLALAFGGVLGGIFINFLAPLLFKAWWDFYFILFSLVLVAGYFILETPAKSKRQQRLSTTTWCLSFVGLVLLFGHHLNTTQHDIVYRHRNFFGSFEIAQTPATPFREAERTLRHGNIIHGLQLTAPDKRRVPTSYYGPKSGITLSIAYQRPLKRQGSPLRTLNLAVIGLGTGTIAALSEVGDRLHFYEIDPDIAHIATHYFSFLKDTPASTEIILGDGRLELQKRFKEIGSDHYDVMAIDAFNGDAIPLHLLTREALEIYLAHLNPEGILAFHISSRYVNLYPPIQALATQLGLHAYLTHNSQEYKNAISASEWVLLSRDSGLGTYLYQKEALLFKPERTDRVWTDDCNNLLAAVRW